MGLELDRYVVREIDKKQAKELIVEFHYTHAWTSCRYAIGLLKDGLTLGVAVYGYPVGRFAAQSISPIVKSNEVFELTRLWISDSEGRNIESWFLSKTFEWLKKHAPNIKVLLSYTDPTYGHIGTVYQATNWLYQGSDIRTANYFMYKIGDEYYHPRTVFSKYKSNDLNTLKKIIPDIKIINMEKKHRYIYILTNKREKKKIIKTLKYPIKPYVKFERKQSDHLINNKKNLNNFFDFED